MQHLGVISPVQEPTPWCAAIVVVPKDSGAVRICVNLKPLNESVLCEVHPMPKVETTLAQLSGAKIFRKLHANSGFWQIPLANESRLLTTFITPFGRLCFNKLPFGRSSAQRSSKDKWMRCFQVYQASSATLMIFSFMERMRLNTNLDYKPHWREFSQLESH